MHHWLRSLRRIRTESGGLRSCQRPEDPSSSVALDALRLLRQAPAVTELSLLDAEGKEFYKASRLAVDVVGSGTDYSKEPKFTWTVANKVYYGSVYLRRESEPYMALRTAGTRRDAGVSVVELNLSQMWEIVKQTKVGDRGVAYVLDAEGRVIAHPDFTVRKSLRDLSSLAHCGRRLLGQL